MDPRHPLIPAGLLLDLLGLAGPEYHGWQAIALMALSYVIYFLTIFAFLAVIRFLLRGAWRVVAPRVRPH